MESMESMEAVDSMDYSIPFHMIHGQNLHFITVYTLFHMESMESIHSIWTPYGNHRGVVSTVSCGLWVLAAIAAVLRGYHLPSLVESDMPSLRHSLYRHILYLPSVS